MEIKIKRLRLRNFKGVREADYYFGGKNATIEGPNGSGKSTVFDAFTWLLFGKDHRDQTTNTFELKTIDPATGKPYPREEHWVEAILTVDGQDHTLRRSWNENWVKPTGETDDVLKGHTSSFYVDGVDVVTKLAFDTLIAGWIKEDNFKLLTNPHYFIDDSFTSWKERRKALLDLVRDDPRWTKVQEDFADVIQKLAGRNIDDYRKRLTLEKNANKRDLATILSNIDGIRMALPKEEDTAAVANRLEILKAKRDKAVAELTEKIEAIDRSIASADEADASRKAENASIWAEITAVQLEMNNSIDKAKDAARAKNNARNEAIFEAQKKLNEATLLYSTHKDKHKTLLSMLSERETHRGRLAADLAALGDRYKEEKARAFDFTAETRCPYCGQEMPATTIEQATVAARDAFLKKQKDVIDGILSTAKEIKQEITDTDASINKLQEQVSSISEKCEQDKTEMSEWTDEVERLSKQPEEDLKSIEDQVRASEEYKALAKKEQELRAKAFRTASRPAEIDELVNRRKEIERAINDEKSSYAKAELQAKEALSVRKVRAEQEELIRKKEGEAKSFADAVARNERDEARAAEYVKAVVDSVEDVIGEMFHVARWKMFDRTMDGGIVEMCEVCDPDGTPYRSMNDAMKILCGIDCICVFSDHIGSVAPIFIDNAEGILQETFDTKAQVIRLVVKDIDKLTLITE